MTLNKLYTDIIKELTEATAALSTTGTIEAGEILYGGNIAQWKNSVTHCC
jgi:hypothetical protein